MKYYYKNIIAGVLAMTVITVPLSVKSRYTISDENNIIKAEAEEAEIKNSYSYEIVPFLEPFNEYFYIKTENPNPDNFRFVDKHSIYSDESMIIKNKTTKYEDSTT